MPDLDDITAGPNTDAAHIPPRLGQVDHCPTLHAAVSRRDTWPLPRGSVRLAEMAAALPGLDLVLSAAYARYFNSARGQIRLFRGVYADFQSALRSIPDHRLSGYDNAPSAKRLETDRLRITASDYPVLFWLCKILPGCRRLFDWGGNVGISYFGYRRYLRYAADLSWLVNDVAAVVARGEQIADGEIAPHLGFTTSLDAMNGADILLAAGSLHFIEDPFDAMHRAPALPRHILINKVPAYGRPSAVTVQNMGSALCANHLFNRTGFVREFESLGYELVDQWRLGDISCRIPFYRGHSIAAYSGYYFRKYGCAS